MPALITSSHYYLESQTLSFSQSRLFVPSHIPFNPKPPFPSSIPTPISFLIIRSEIPRAYIHEELALIFLFWIKYRHLIQHFSLLNFLISSLIFLFFIKYLYDTTEFSISTSVVSNPRYIHIYYGS